MAHAPTAPRAAAGLLLLPLAGLALLLAAPGADVHWEHHPSHFWLVLSAAIITSGLALTTGEAAGRRGDARLFLWSLAFVAAGGFLALHALATPGVLLARPNQGFAIAPPVGLLVAAVLAAASAAPLSPATARGLMARTGLLRGALGALLGVWAVLSLGELPPLDGPPLEAGSAPLVALAVPALLLYAYAAARYVQLDGGDGSPLVLAVAASLVLLAEGMFAVAVARNWHASWWEWHVLMLTAFAVVAITARRVPPAERYGDLYLPETARATREVSVLFADLAGFTAWSETHGPEEVSSMLDAHLAVAQGAVVREGGDTDRVMGDAVLATFGSRGDQPDHAERAARAALALRDAEGALAHGHPDWPRLRIGVNTGPARVGVLGRGQGRTYTVIGDAVNVAARLQAAAEPGQVLVSEATLALLPHPDARALGRLALKGRSEPVAAHALDRLGSRDG